MAVNSKPFSLTVIALCQVLALSVWFAGAAALPALNTVAPLSPLQSAALSSAVQLGFVLGALISAATGVADRFDARWVFGLGALIASGFSALALLLDPGG